MNNSEVVNGMDLKPEVVYHPVFEETVLVKFKTYVEEKYKLKLKDYWEFHEWSCTNYPEFWECVWSYFNVLHTSPYTQVFDKKNGFLNAKWFEGVRLNFAANILRFRDSHVALIGTDGEDNTQYITYNELYDEVKVYIRALKDAGIQKGDVVTCYLPNKIEPVFICLATAAIGAIWSGSLPTLGSKGVLARFAQVNPKIIFTGGNFFYKGTEIRMDLKVSEIVAGLPSLVKVVFIPSKTKGKAEDITKIPKCVFLSEFLANARSIHQDDSSDIEFEQVPFDYPVCISFTSGTTGAPKGLVHSASMLLASLKEFALHQNCTRKDTLLNVQPVGWISWQLSVNNLCLGLTLIMYDGDPFMSSPTRYWDLVDKFGITSAFLRADILENMERKGYLPTENHSLKTLRQILCFGSLVKPSSLNSVAEKIKPNLFRSPLYGATEVFGLIAGFDSNVPVHKGELQCFSLGMDIRILDENDQPVIGKRGEIVLANPYPALPVCLLNDENKQLMNDLYLSQHPGYWNIGDEGWVSPITKGIVVYGRNDETIRTYTARFTCAEINFALEEIPGFMDSVCVSQFNSRQNSRVVLFVKTNPGQPLTEDVKKEIKKKIVHHLSVDHVPDIIMEAPDIPYNLNGKKLTGLVKKLINKRPVSNMEIVINPSSVDFFQTVDLGPF